MSGKRRVVLFWVLAILVTGVVIVFQRLVGPTRPARGSVALAGESIRYRLERSHGGPENHQVKIRVPDPNIAGHMVYQRYRLDEAWTRVDLVYEDGALVGELPHQPVAGKLLYRVTLTRGGSAVQLPPGQPVVIRFRGGVPDIVLWPHVIFMLLGMLWSNHAGLAALRGRAEARPQALWALILLVLGGLIFGPLVQWYSFGALWTGFPFGHDLTDNKTLLAVLAWIAAVVACRRSPERSRGWIMAAALVTLGIFLIPHSVLGTELDYTQLPAQP